MQKRRAIPILTGTLLFLIAPFAFAQEKEGFYIGGNFGWTRIDAGNSMRDLENELVASGFASASAQLDEKSTGFKILGGFQVNPNFALEAYYANLGKYDFSVITSGPTVSGSGDIKLKGFGFDAVGLFPFAPTLSGLGRVGLFLWDSEARFSASDGVTTVETSTSDDGNELKLGIGLEWKVGPGVRLRGELEYYNFEERVTVLSVGLVYRFD